MKKLILVVLLRTGFRWVAVQRGWECVFDSRFRRLHHPTANGFVYQIAAIAGRPKGDDQ